jgi:hypothetical protein
MRAALVPLCLLVLAGCPQDIPISALVPEIVITPGELVFGEQAVPVPVAQDLVISNGGRADLDVELSKSSSPRSSLTLSSSSPAR